MSESEENAKISVSVIYLKRPVEMETVEVEKNATISNLKEVVAKRFNAQPSQLSLIFTGKTMRDQDTLATYNIKDGSVVHLIIKTNDPQNNSTITSSTNTKSTQTQRPPADINASRLTLNVRVGLSGLKSLCSVNPLINRMFFGIGYGRQLILFPIGEPMFKEDPDLFDIMHNPRMVHQIMEIACNKLMGTQDRESPEEINLTTFTTPSERSRDFSNETSAPTLDNIPTEEIADTLINGDTMNSDMPQMIVNPQNTQSMLNFPFFQSIVQAMNNDPNKPYSISIYNPLLANNGELQISNSAVQDMSTYPNVVIFQLQPSHVPSLTCIPIKSQSFFSKLKAHITANPDSTVPNSIPSTEGQDNFAELMRKMRSQLPPEEIYNFQLNQLYALGFSSQEARLQALIAATSVHINNATKWLISRGRTEY